MTTYIEKNMIRERAGKLPVMKLEKLLKSFLQPNLNLVKILGFNIDLH